MTSGSYERVLLEETREEITRADSKASILFGVFGLLAGTVTYAFLRGQWEPTELVNAIEWLWWLGAALGASAVLLLGRAIYPVVDHPGDKNQVAYFGHVAQFESRLDFIHALAKRETSEVDRLRDQIWILSKAVDLKYRCTRWAMRLALSGLVAMIAAVAGDAFLL